MAKKLGFLVFEPADIYIDLYTYQIYCNTPLISPFFFEIDFRACLLADQ